MAKEFNVKEFMLITVFGLAFIQLIAYILGNYVPALQKVKIGLFFYILIIAAAIYLAYVLITQDFSIDKSKAFILLIVLAILVFLMFKIKALIPEIFSIAATQMYSAIGLI